MSMPPPVDALLDDVLRDPRYRHDALVDVFGRYLMWVRDSVLHERSALVESSELRESLATLFRKPLDELASLNPEQREIAYEFATHCVDAFAQELLRLLSNAGYDLALSDGNVVRFRLILELCNGITGDVVSEEVLNRGGKHFPDYWGRWLNRYAERLRRMQSRPEQEGPSQ